MTNNGLPESLPPRGLSRVQAAAYIGVKATFFDKLISQKIMPKPKLIGHRRVWDRHKLDIAFDQINGDYDSEIENCFANME